MGAMGPCGCFSASYVHDDEELRRAFDRRLARYLRGHCERWDITAIVEPLQLLGGKARQVDVYLARGATGQLSVTLGFELAPAGTAERRSTARAGLPPTTGKCRSAGSERLSRAAAAR